MSRVWNLVRYGFVFLRALVTANVDVARRALSPGLRIRPGFVAVPMDAASDLEITLLANSITLTPGTISVHVTGDRRAIIVHAIDVGDDPEAVRRDVKRTLEANILNWTRPTGRTA